MMMSEHEFEARIASIANVLGAVLAIARTGLFCLVLGDEQFLLAPLGLGVVGDGQHQANAVFLIDLRRRQIVVDGHDIDARVYLREPANHALSADVIGQAAERLGTDYVWNSAFYKLQHFCG